MRFGVYGNDVCLSFRLHYFSCCHASFVNNVYGILVVIHFIHAQIDDLSLQAIGHQIYVFHNDRLSSDGLNVLYIHSYLRLNVEVIVTSK